MGRLDRYLFSTAAIAFLAVLGSLTTLVWLTQVLRRFDLLATQGQSFFVFMTITALALPMLMLVIAPIALFIAIVFTLNRLSADSELIVMNAAGVSRWRIFRPLFALTMIVATLTIAVSAEVGPWTLRTLREQISKVNADIVSNVAIPGRFMSMDRGLTFHVRERSPDGLMLGIFVFDARNQDNETTYIAERGRIVHSPQGAYLILDGGVMQRRQGQNKSPNFVEFQRYAFDMSQLTPNQHVLYRATDRTLYDLVTADESDEMYKQDPGRFRAELHKRLSAPLFPIAAFVLAFAFLGEARTTRQSRGLAIAGAAGAFALVEIFGFGTSGMVARNAALTWITYLVPVAGILYGLAVIAGFAQFRVPALLQKIADLLSARFERLRTA
ncbi:MAG: LPS export ABC transporter permease LptF [Rhizobiales bacterium]|jgi:lipopolysaccharide export system permease protein|nr:LPS export ABC transporter permease LptF [Hyphomicrobiales bacterium]